MATVYGNIYKGDGYGEQVYLDYTVSQTGSKLTVIAKAGIKAATKAISIDTSAMLIDSVMCGIYTGTYQSTDYDSNQKAFTLSKGSTKQLVTKTLTFDKSKAGSQTITLKAYSLISWLGLIMTEATTSNSSYVGVNLTVPQKTSYAIKFNANGGSGTPPSDLTKWDSETAYLPYNTLTRKGYDFVGWGTSEAGGTIYLEGAAYTGNAAATLYAIWKSNYIAPTLSNLTATRAARDGEEYVESDDGTLAHVKFNYSVPYEDYEELSHTIKIGIKEVDEDEYSYVLVQGMYELVDVVIESINLDTEKTYDIIAVIEAEGYTAISRHTYIAAAYYIIDVNTDGTAIGFGTAVDDEDNGLISGFPISINDESGNTAFSVGLDGIPYCRNANSDYGTIFNLIYPVGSIYMSANAINPSILFGGTWEQIENKFLLAAGSAYTAGSTGGSADASVIAHTHSVTGTAASNGAHTHSMKEIWSDGSGSKSAYTMSSSRKLTTRSTASAGAHTHSVSGTAASTGVAAAGKNMPPYLAVYVWKRTA